ncbi:MAG: carboxypeptidase regulatory-like domain-containing protein, partial [Acidobacteriota bacterium]|nr:carboxypeptidase regulatory-like domain-containing protein [Acidobacteriota bacterium]
MSAAPGALRTFLGAVQAVVLAGALLTGSANLWGQASQVSQIAGTVEDSTGAVISGATVTITNTGTGAARSATSGADGNYILTNLVAGQYRLQASKEGFAEYVLSKITINVSTNPHINITLQVGGVTQQVEVTADASMVETHSNGVGQVIDQDRVVDLPLNGRQVTQLVTLAGGATNFVPTNAGQSLISNKNYPTSVAFSVAGGQGGQTLFLLDGGNNMDVVSNIGLPMPFPDALQEFKVETSSLPANYGNQPGGVVNVVTKSGSNAIHGNAFDFLRNYSANARNFFAPQRDSLKRNQFGGTIGGPIIKNKLFFFAGYQGTRESVAPSANTTFTVTAAELGGDFSALATCNKVTLKAPFVNNQIAPGLFNPIALKVLKMIPVSSDPCGRVTYGIPSADHENQFVGRGDWQVSGKESVFVRYFITDYQHPPYYQDNLLTLSTDASAGLADRVNTVVMGDTYSINPTTVSSFRAGFSRQSIIRYAPDTVPTWTQLGS